MSNLEDLFAQQLDAAGIKYMRQFKALQGRRYRWDFHISGTNILVEINGAIFVPHTGHTSPGGIQRDYTKSNLATAEGWRQLTFTRADIDSGNAISLVRRLCLPPSLQSFSSPD